VFSTKFRKILKYHENPSVRAEFFHGDRLADGQTDRHDEANLIDAFRNFAKAPKLY